MTVKRRGDTHCQVLGKVISTYVGERIRAIRQQKEMSMEELGLRAGLTTGSNLKQRVYAIEHNLRDCGMRFGTLYQIAIALEVEITELMPSTETIKAMTGARLMNAAVLARS